MFKKIGVLSGGERGRVALAKLALQGANLLLLDEPTNHLDIPSQEILEAVLSDFPGTILLVSHDRYLIDALATQIWSVEDGELELFKGSWSEYVAARTDEGRRTASRDEGQKSTDDRRRTTDDRRPPRTTDAEAARGARALTAATRGSGRRGDSEAAAQKKQKAEERKQAARLSELEAGIAALEQRLAELVRDLEDAGGDVARVRNLGEEYAAVEADLKRRLLEWEAVIGN